MRKKTFLLNTAVITCSSLVIRIIAMSFKVYMSSLIGAQALGLYQLIITIYTFMISFISSGITLAVTRLVTDYIAKKRTDLAKKTTKTAFLFALVLSIVLMIALFFATEPMSIYILKDQRADLPLKILSLSLPFVSISSVCRGYFFAVRKVLKATTEQILEQIIEIIVFSLLINSMLPKGIEYACCAVVIGSLAGEVVSFIYSYILYRLDISKLTGNTKIKLNGNNKVLSKLIKISTPMTGSACLRSGLCSIENIMIPKGLTKQGSSYEKSLADYGRINGMAMPVITFPSAFLMAFSMLLIPEISQANTLKHYNNIKHIATKVFIITFIFAIPIAGLLFFFGRDLCQIIYNDTDSGIYVSLLAPIIPFMYLDSVVDGILKGLNDQVRYFTYNMIESAIRIILILILLPIMGIKGLIIVIFTGEIINSTLSILRLIKLTKLKFDFINWVFKPIVSITVPCILVKICNFNFFPENHILILTVKVLIICTVYILLLKLLKAIKDEDRIWIIKNLKSPLKLFR